MPVDNCSIYVCPVSCRAKFKGIAIFKVPSGSDEFNSRWRDKLVAVITRNRERNSALNQQIKSTKVFICQRHFREDQYQRHESRVTLNPGEVPTLNLPVKSFTTTTTQSAPRESFTSVLQKRSLCNNEDSPQQHECYKSFSELSNRVKSLKLEGWQWTSFQDHLKFFNIVDTFAVPKYEIFVDQELEFTIRIFLWKLPSNHDIYNTYNKSLKSETISELLKLTC